MWNIICHWCCVQCCYYIRQPFSILLLRTPNILSFFFNIQVVFITYCDLLVMVFVNCLLFFLEAFFGTGISFRINVRVFYYILNH